MNEWHDDCEICRHGQDIPDSAICEACTNLSEYQPTYAVLEARVKELEAENKRLGKRITELEKALEKQKSMKIEKIERLAGWLCHKELL